MVVLVAGSEVCGARLGFRRGDHCRVLAEPDQPHCGGHLNAYARIAKAEADTRRTTQQELDRCRAADYRRLTKLLDNAAAVARSWWFDSGVRAIPTRLRDDVLFYRPCVYCGDTSPTEIDHIFPVSRGGLSEWYNLAPACFLCNREKSDMPVNVWREARIRQGLVWPPEPRSVRLAGIVTNLLDAASPPDEIADLWEALRLPSPTDLSGGVADDSRWRAARAVYLDPETGHFRRSVAIEVMYRIEIEHEEANPS